MGTEVMPACAHHWVIEPASKGKQSAGECIHCEEKRQFQDFFDMQVLGDSRARGRRRVGRAK